MQQISVLQRFAINHLAICERHPVVFASVGDKGLSGFCQAGKVRAVLVQIAAAQGGGWLG